MEINFPSFHDVGTNERAIDLKILLLLLLLLVEESFEQSDWDNGIGSGLGCDHAVITVKRRGMEKEGRSGRAGRVPLARGQRDARGKRN